MAAQEPRPFRVWWTCPEDGHAIDSSDQETAAADVTRHFAEQRHQWWRLVEIVEQEDSILWRPVLIYDPPATDDQLKDAVAILADALVQALPPLAKATEADRAALDLAAEVLR